MFTKTITINDLQISYVELNFNIAETIIFIHGNSNSKKFWFKQLKSAALQGFRLIAIDLPGHGQSSKCFQPRDYSIPNMANIVSSVIEQLCFDRPYTICGFSLGSNIAVETLVNVRKPKGIILISPTIVGQSVTPGDLNDDRIVGEVLYSSDVTDDLLFQYIDFAFDAESISEKFYFETEYRNTDNIFRSGLLESALAGSVSDEIAILNESGVQCLIIISNNDKVVAQEIYERKGVLSENVRLIKINAQHYSPLEHPEIITFAIHDFIDCL